ncbi:MAG: thioredoxin [Oscillatoriales cyanobacterium RM1_1_9]|nr:thioredoxin [Oscillatoriales cyanobacterium SM2_3_0]NJO45341.1 thioredoxin [Oscillatoriales cyanobacterium RM2_1_1]NJO71240.1 thioredoxin [Oscillatoriales cyanobacterium RM1_1_9]
MSQSVITIQDPEFEAEVLNSETPVLAYFWASWCGPCRLISPAIESVALTYGDRLKVVKLEVDASPNSVKMCQVEGVPALRLFKDKQIVQSHEGAIIKPKLIDWLEAGL